MKNIKTMLLTVGLLFTGLILGSHENSLLYSAVKKGKKNEVIKLIGSNVEINYGNNEENKTALHCAAEKGDIEIAKILIDAGANLNSRANWMWTPLHWAVYVGSLDMVNLLIVSGADLSLYTIGAYNAFGLAIWYNRVNIAKLIACYDPTIAFGYYSSEQIGLNKALYFSDSIEILKLLIDLGANVNYQDRNNAATALHTAVDNNNFEKVKLLLQAGALTNIQDKDGLFAVDYAQNNKMKKLLK